MLLVVKLSGEGLSEGGNKYAHNRLHLIADQIKTLLGHGHQLAVVIGGGNLFRGKDLVGNLGVLRTTAEYVGMLATVQNALVLRDYFESIGIASRVLSAISMPQVCESSVPNRANEHLERGRVVIFAAGLGAPYFTTDTCAIQRGLEIGAKLVIMAKNGVDGVYTADPKKDPSAKFIPELTCTEALERGIAVADAAALGLAKEQKLLIKIVAIEKLSEALLDGTGTTVFPK